MDEEKVVSIEDRIPKLKEARRKKSNRRLIFYLCLFFVLISVVVYLQSPLSYINTIDVSGNHYTDSDYIIEQSGLSEKVNFWSFKTANIETKLTNAPEIKEASVERVFPNHVELHIIEYNQVAYVNQGDSYGPLLENGTILDPLPKNDYSGDAPIINDFNNPDYLNNFDERDYLMLFTEQLAKLPKTIATHISEIYWEPTESNPFLIKLFMNDGFTVIVSIRQFSNQMSSYPSIASQLTETTGTIEMNSGGAIFNSNDLEDDDDLNEESEEGEDPEVEREEDEVDYESEG